MAKSIAVSIHFGDNNVDTVRFMNFLFRPQGVSTSESQNQIIPNIIYSKGRFTLSNIEQFHRMNIYSLDGRLLNTVRFQSTNLGETTIPWIPPNKNIYIISLVGNRDLKSIKIYCY